MRIGLGVTSLLRGLKCGGIDGIGVYTKNLLSGLVLDKEHDTLGVSFGDCAADNLDSLPIEILPDFRKIAGWSFLTGLQMPFSRDLIGKVDVFHSTDHRIPKITSLPIVATIHDAIPLIHPEFVSLRYRTFSSPIFRRSVKWASRIITPSEYSKQTIAEHLLIDPLQISVISHGVNSEWSLPLDKERLRGIRNRYKLSKRYILNVGTLQPRKNISRLIDAYNSLPRALQEECDLVLVGRVGWDCADELSRISSGARYGKLHWLQYVPQSELLDLFKGALCFAMPSLAEGFGFPIIESFAAKVPVLTSSVTSLPEVARDAAFLVEPYRVDSIRHGLERLLEDGTLREDLIMKGLLRVKDFSWEKAFAETKCVYSSVI